MMKMRSVMVLLLLWAVVEGKVFERCTWARLLKSSTMDGVGGIDLANWVCLTKWESSYNTSTVNHNRDGSTDYGIFQINSKYWCKDRGVSKANGCKIQCTQMLTDDPTVSINCAKVVAQQQGAKAWVAWKKHCKGHDVSSYVAGCGLELADDNPDFL